MRWRSGFILWLFSCAAIAAAFGWAFLAHPALDDFCLSVSSLSVGDVYRSWSGRWLAFLIYEMTFAGSAFINYWLWIALGLGLWWIAFVAALNDRRVGTIAFALFIAGMPSQAEGLFFATNVVAYTLPFLLAVVALRAPWQAAIVAGLLVSGLSEWIGAFVLTLTLVRKDWRLAAAVAVGLVISLAAPGNFARASVFHPSLLVAFGHTLKNYDSVLAFVADPRLILFAIWLMAKERKEGEVYALPVVSCVSVVGILGLAFLMGGPAPGRVLNIAYAAIVIGFVITAQSAPWRLDMPRWARQALAVGLGLSMLTSPNIGAMVRDLPDALRGQHVSPLLDEGGVAWADACIKRFEAR